MATTPIRPIDPLRHRTAPAPAAAPRPDASSRKPTRHERAVQEMQQQRRRARAEPAPDTPPPQAWERAIGAWLTRHPRASREDAMRALAALAPRVART